MKYYIGLDIGGTKCGACVGGLTADKQMQILEKQTFATDNQPYGVILQRFEAIVAAFLQKYRVESIGIACGGPLDNKKGIIQSPPNLPGWDNVEIVAYFQSRFSIPTKLENDANACAVAEWLFGAGKGTNNMIFMTFGTGLGAGLILDGKLYAGTNGNAGEVGHVRMEKDGPVGYNKAGSAEGFCSGNGVKNLALLRAAERGISLPSTVTAKDIFTGAKAGDTFYVEIVKECAEQFARVVSMLVDLFNPEVIVAGGVFMRNYELFMSYMRPILERECLPASLAVCKILPAKIGENVGDYSALAIATTMGE